MRFAAWMYMGGIASEMQAKETSIVSAPSSSRRAEAAAACPSSQWGATVTRELRVA